MPFVRGTRLSHLAPALLLLPSFRDQARQLRRRQRNKTRILRRNRRLKKRGTDAVKLKQGQCRLTTAQRIFQQHRRQRQRLLHGHSTTSNDLGRQMGNHVPHRQGRVGRRGHRHVERGHALCRVNRRGRDGLVGCGPKQRIAAKLKGGSAGWRLHGVSGLRGHIHRSGTSRPLMSQSEGRGCDSTAFLGGGITLE